MSAFASRSPVVVVRSCSEAEMLFPLANTEDFLQQSGDVRAVFVHGSVFLCVCFLKLVLVPCQASDTIPIIEEPCDKLQLQQPYTPYVGFSPQWVHGVILHILYLCFTALRSSLHTNRPQFSLCRIPAAFQTYRVNTNPDSRIDFY